MKKKENLSKGVISTDIIEDYFGLFPHMVVEIG